MSQHKHTWMVIVENGRALAFCMTDVLENKNIVTAEQFLSGEFLTRERCRATLDQTEIEERLNRLESQEQ